MVRALIYTAFAPESPEAASARWRTVSNRRKSVKKSLAFADTVPTVTLQRRLLAASILDWQYSHPSRHPLIHIVAAQAGGAQRASEETRTLRTRDGPEIRAEVQTADCLLDQAMVCQPDRAAALRQVRGGGLSTGPSGGVSSGTGGGMSTGPAPNLRNIQQWPVFIGKLEYRGMHKCAQLIRRLLPSL